MHRSQNSSIFRTQTLGEGFITTGSVSREEEEEEEEELSVGRLREPAKFGSRGEEQPGCRMSSFRVDATRWMTLSLL